MIRLEPGHRAVVIGVGAIGAAVCRAYAAAGAAVVALDLVADLADRVAGALPGAGHQAAELDVTDLPAVRQSAAMAVATGGVSSVCFTAGVAPTSEVLAFDWAEYRRTMQINLDGALHVAHAFGRELVATSGGSMTFVSSVAGRRGEAGAAAYCASKFALRGVVESFAAEVGHQGVRINAICPGDVDTPMLAQVARAQAVRHGSKEDAEIEAMRGAAALRRLVTPDEVADVALWLASEHASAITGASIDVTAGLGY
jgi:NAD(P)-dependent dehydrogenase (short-subunit alcohol dehydrogenase family)